MISLEQIRALESKVHKAVALLSAAQEENKLLKERLASYETRVDELEFMIEEFKDEQSEIEQGIISALQHLDSLEDAVVGMKPVAAADNKTAASSKPEASVKQEIAPKPAPEPAETEKESVEAAETTEPESAETEVETVTIETRPSSSWEAETNETVDDFADDEESESQKDQRQLDIF